MKRIMFMHQSSSIGGGSYCLLNVVKALDKTIWEPVVALKNHGPLEDELCKLGVDVVLFPQMRDIPYNHPLGWREILAYRKVLRSEKACEELLRRERIEVLYLNNMMIAPYLRPAKRVGCKTVMHVREHWPLDEHKNQLEWVRKIVYENCDKMIAINHYSASIFPKMNATIVYDWIDMSVRYKPLPLNEIFEEDLIGKKVLLFTGGVSYIKGTDYVLEAFSKYVKGDEYRLLLLGGGNMPLRGWKAFVKKLLEKAGRVGFSKRVEDLMSSDYRIKCAPAIFELSHIIEQSCCFLSYFRVPHANLSLAENIILSNPCIAAKTEESLEYTNNGEYALLVEPNSVDEFGHHLQDFLNDIEKWKKASESGVNYLSNMFMPDDNIKKLNKVLSSVLTDVSV